LHPTAFHLSYGGKKLTFSNIHFSKNVMRDALREAEQRLACEIDSDSVPRTRLIAADPWVVSSLLQKSIRRGETQISARCGIHL
jgi:hypothetical protein